MIACFWFIIWALGPMQTPEQYATMKGNKGIESMLAKVNSAAVVGLEGRLVEVEVDISNGLPSTTIVGLPDTAVQESRERVRSAIRNSGCTFPTKRITINLAPADLKKAGPAYDLPIAVGIILSSEQADLNGISQALFPFI